MVNWQLSKQGIHWPVSQNYIVGSGLRNYQGQMFFYVDHWPDTGFSNWIASPSQDYSGGERGIVCKGRILVQINHCRVIDPSLGKSLTQCVCNFYNLGYAFWVYCLLKYNWKKLWIQMLNACN